MIERRSDCTPLRLFFFGDCQVNIYDKTFESLDREWLHNIMATIFSSDRPTILDKDLAVLCRWLRGMHRHVFSNTGDYWAAYTQPYHQYGPWSATFIRGYVVRNWVFVSEYIPTLPSSPSSPIEIIGGGKDGDWYEQRALL